MGIFYYLKYIYKWLIYCVIHILSFVIFCARGIPHPQRTSTPSIAIPPYAPLHFLSIYVYKYNIYCINKVHNSLVLCNKAQVWYTRNIYNQYDICSSRDSLSSSLVSNLLRRCVIIERNTYCIVSVCWVWRGRKCEGVELSSIILEHTIIQ